MIDPTLDPGEPVTERVGAAPQQGPVPTDALARAVKRLTGRTPAEIAADRERVLALVPAPRPLPAGSTVLDVVVGKWPGSESDAQITKALSDLS